MSRVLFLASWRRMKGGQTLPKSPPSPLPLQTKNQFLPVGGLMAADPMETSLQASLAGQHKPWGKSVSPAEEKPILGPSCLVATLFLLDWQSRDCRRSGWLQFHCIIKERENEDLKVTPVALGWMTTFSLLHKHLEVHSCPPLWE